MNGNRTFAGLCVGMHALRSICALLIASACADPEGSPPAEVSVADSAGVRIVQFAADVAWSHLELADEPTVTISSDDAAAFQLHRVMDAAFLPDGGLAVANGGDSQVLVFDASGQLVRYLGRSGSGPGEFRALRWIAVKPPDSIVAIDQSLRRVTLFEPRGTVARIVDAAGGSTDGAAIGEFAPQPIGILADGAVVMASYTSLPPEAGSVRRQIELSRFRPDPGVHESLGSTPGDELHLLLADGRFQVLTPPFARSTVIRVARNGYFVGDTDRPEIRGYGEQGDLRSVIRWQGAGQRITDEILEADIRYRFRSLGEGPAFQQRVTEQRRISTHLTSPAFRAMLLGSDGRIWIGRHGLVSDSVVWWFGIDLDAGTVSSAMLPNGMEPLAFDHDEVAVLVRDELETESIRRYRLEKR